MGPLAGPFSVFLFLSAGTVSLFSFLAVASWSSARLKERESFYKNDMLKKLSENPGQGAGAALEVIREESRIAGVRRQASLREGGLVCASVGIAISILLKALIHDQPVYLCGLMVLLPGLALVFSFYMLSNDKRRLL